MKKTGKIKRRDSCNLGSGLGQVDLLHARPPTFSLYNLSIISLYNTIYNISIIRYEFLTSVSVKKGFPLRKKCVRIRKKRLPTTRICLTLENTRVQLLLSLQPLNPYFITSSPFLILHYYTNFVIKSKTFPRKKLDYFIVFY